MHQPDVPNCTGAGYIFISCLVDAILEVKRYDYVGKLVREVYFPGVGSARGFGGKDEAETLYNGFTNYKTPGVTYAVPNQHQGNGVNPVATIDGPPPWLCWG